MQEVYDNEVSVGEALRRTKVPREDIFSEFGPGLGSGTGFRRFRALALTYRFTVTSKVGPGMKDIRAAAQRSLSNLGVKYLDLFLIHFTTDLDKEGYLTREEAWKIMEELKVGFLCSSTSAVVQRSPSFAKSLAYPIHSRLPHCIAPF